jgi:hypothetical protein
LTPENLHQNDPLIPAQVLHPTRKEVEDTVAIGSDESKAVTGLTVAGLGVWVAQVGPEQMFLYILSDGREREKGKIISVRNQIISNPSGGP